MAKTYANNHEDMYQDGVKCGEDQFSGGITNGAHWYNVKGILLKHSTD